MISVGEDGAPTLCDAVHGPCQPRRNGFHPPTERFAIARFHDEMRVVALQRIVDEAKPFARATDGERPLELVHDRHRPQGRHVASHPQRDVRWQRRAEVRARCVSEAGSRAGPALAPCARPTPTPTRAVMPCQRQLPIATTHLDWAMLYDHAFASSTDPAGSRPVPPQPYFGAMRTAFLPSGIYLSLVVASLALEGGPGMGFVQLGMPWNMLLRAPSWILTTSFVEVPVNAALLFALGRLAARRMR